MKKLVLLITTLIISTGCKYSIHGDLNVTDSFKLGSHTYDVGSYNANVGVSRTVFTGRYKLNLKVETAEGTISHKFKAPKGMNLPKNGNFNYSAEQLKQPYGLAGDVRTDYQDDRRRRVRYESCTYQEPHQVCRTDRNGRTTCHTEYRVRYGRMQIEYFLRTVDQDLNFNIMNGANAVANFRGHYNDTYEVNTYEGRCY